jgi:putative transposase
MLQKRPFWATGHIDAAGVANAATVQEYRAKWRRVNETNPLERADETPPDGLATSHGASVDPAHFAKAEKRLRRTQRRVSRRKKYSKGWRKAVQLVQNVHRDIRNQRRDFQHKLSREIVDANQFIAVEDLNVIGLAGGMLAKSVADVGWSSFLKMLAYKAESAGRQLVRVDPRGTSQRCPCGKPAPKKLADRQHVCTCGLRTTRDHASSLEILRLGLSLQPLTAVQ